MKKMLFAFILIFLFLAGCQEKEDIDSIYKEFVQSEYYKETIHVTINENTTKLGTFEIVQDSVLIYLDNSSDFVYLKIKENSLNMYMLNKYTTIPLEFSSMPSEEDIPILITKKEKTDFGFIITYDLKEIDFVDTLSEDTTFSVSFYLTENKITKITCDLPEIIIKLLEMDIKLELDDIEYGKKRPIVPDVSTYEYLENTEFLIYCLPSLFPNVFPPLSPYELEIVGGNTITTKTNEEPKLQGYLQVDMTSHQKYKLDLSIKDEIDYSIPGKYYTSAYVQFEGITYETDVIIKVVDPHYEFKLTLETLIVPINGSLDIQCFLYDVDLGVMEVTDFTISDDVDLTKEGIYTVTVSTEYDGKTYTTSCVIEVKNPHYELTLEHEYDLITEIDTPINLDNLNILLKPKDPYFHTFYDLKLEINGTVDFTKLGNYPITISVNYNNQIYTKEFTVQVIDSTTTLEDTIELEEKILDTFKIDGYLLLATSSTLYKYDIEANQVVGSVDLKCQYSHYYFKDSYLYVTANYPYTSEYLENNEYSGTVSKIDFERFTLISQVEVNFYPYSIIVDKRNQAIITMGLNQHVDLISLDFDSKTWEKIDYSYMKSELYYSFQEDSFILISTQTTALPRLFTWDSINSKYTYKAFTTEYGYNLFARPGQYVLDTSVVFIDNIAIYTYDFKDYVDKSYDLVLDSYTIPEYSYLDQTYLYRSYLPYNSQYFYIIKYDLTANLFTYKKINANNLTKVKFEEHNDVIYLLNNSTGIIEIYKYSD